MTIYHQGAFQIGKCFLTSIGVPIIKNNIPDSKVYGANMGPSGADRTQVGPMLTPWTLLSAMVSPQRQTMITLLITWYWLNQRLIASPNIFFQAVMNWDSGFMLFGISPLLTHDGLVMAYFIIKLFHPGLGNGLSPDWYQAITWVNADLLSIEPFRNKFQWNFNQNSYISFWKMFSKMSLVKPSCPACYVLIHGSNLSNAPSQWETTLHCNIISRWLGAYTKRFLWMGPANDRGCYIVRSSLIGWAHTQKDYCWYLSTKSVTWPHWTISNIICSLFKFQT